MQEHVGYQLIDDASGAVVQFWGGTRGSCPSVPNPLILPNGDHACGVIPGRSTGGYTLTEWCVTPDIATVKAEAKTAVSVGAEQARGKYITTGSGKAMSYQQVAAEAVRYVATNGTGAYPFLQARVTSGRYADLAAAATGTLAIEQQWATVGSSIDMLEDKAKMSIDAATTVEQIQAATQVTWP
jgi:hypothetical protein